MAISIKNLVIERSKAINDMSLEIPETGCFAFLGPNGAGKTTLVNVICGLLKRDAGKVTVFDLDPSMDAMEIRKSIGLVTQETALYEYLSGKENLEFHARFYGVPKQQRAIKVQEALRLAGLEERARDKVSAYSGGMKRRLALVRALLHEPRIIILDEPTLGIDVQSRNEIWNHINKLKQDKLVVLNTNYMDEADRLANLCAIIDKGKLITIDAPEALKRKHAGGVKLDAIVEIEESEFDTLKKAIAGMEKDDKSEIIPLDNPDNDLMRHSITVPSEKPTNQILTEFSGLVQQFKTIRIVDLNVRVPSLDDVFLALTGKSLKSEEV